MALKQRLMEQERAAAREKAEQQKKLLEQEMKVLELKLRLQESVASPQAAQNVNSATTNASVASNVCSPHTLIPAFNDKKDDLDAKGHRAAECWSRTKGNYRDQGRTGDKLRLRREKFATGGEGTREASCVVSVDKEEGTTDHGGYVVLQDGETIPIVNATTPFFSGEVRAKCMQDPLYDVVLGNIKGAVTLDTSTSAENGATTVGTEDDENPVDAPQHSNDVTEQEVPCSSDDGKEGEVRKGGVKLNLHNSDDSLHESVAAKDCELVAATGGTKLSDAPLPVLASSVASIDSNTLRRYQKEDVSLNRCFSAVGKKLIAKSHETEFFLKDGILFPAQDARTVMILSSFSTVPLEDVRAAAPGCLLWQQTYIFRDRTVTKSLVERATARGFSAIVVTADSPVYGDRVQRHAYAYNLPQGLSFANVAASLPNGLTGRETRDEFSSVLDALPSATWNDIEWLCRLSNLPVVVKGVLTVAAVGDKMEVYLDSGVRTGADVVKALALGARAVFVGRPVLWGLAYDCNEVEYRDVVTAGAMALFTMADIQNMAEAKLEEGTRTYISLGAGHEQTLRENTEAFRRILFRPRIFGYVESVNTSTTILGRAVSFPVGLAPSAAHKMEHPDGEIGSAKGKALCRSPMLSPTE
ncbi:hypothetical protein HPB52_006603 [Rhipicephalus sanguineus]|uniref:FMN hydroxy acid dehydrogenase domain-containing protein n=1 Tax=Rhipicephalus sanguineus TaxID=34632 RepID=A0A9D4QCR1_RHISA|nr:hypothetical protein HPB52_006603 [Rhipicephalus sanguineus]